MTDEQKKNEIFKMIKQLQMASDKVVSLGKQVVVEAKELQIKINKIKKLSEELWKNQ